MSLNTYTPIYVYIRAHANNINNCPDLFSAISKAIRRVCIEPASPLTRAESRTL